ncbi:MAG: glycosyl transferase family 2, partial [Elusimicrobia bacterium HGW-Elusimicrobia-4]
DQQFLVESVACKLKIGDIPVPAKYFSEASSINFLKSCKYGMSGLIFVFRYLLHRAGIIHSKIFTKK